MIPEFTNFVESFAGSKVVRTSSIAGGCINQAFAIELADGRRLFAKLDDSTFAAEMFRTEAAGLRLLEGADVVRVPEVFDLFAMPNVATKALLMEHVESATAAPGFSERFGRALAQLHRTTQSQFGLDHDNFIGATVQPNRPCDEWSQFWIDNRFGFQVKLARKNGFADTKFNLLADKLIRRMPELLATDESASLIHGDLWSGNYLVGLEGEPVLIDPAAYFAHREAEFGMTMLFGGFDQRFYSAYNEVWPLQSGSEDRIEIYKLYHLLNHLNLFGISYRDGCLNIMKKFA